MRGLVWCLGITSRLRISWFVDGGRELMVDGGLMVEGGLMVKGGLTGKEGLQGRRVDDGRRVDG